MAVGVKLLGQEAKRAPQLVISEAGIQREGAKALETSQRPLLGRAESA